MTDTPAMPSRSRSLLTSIISVLNVIVHYPVLDQINYYSYWVGFYILFGPILVVSSLLFDIINPLINRRERVVGSLDKPVLITGSDTGLGRMLAVRLAGKGFKVYAGCLTTQAMDELAKESPNIVPLHLDVTSEDHINSAAELIRSECPGGLHGLVNNAGISITGNTDWLSMGDFRKTMEVNFFSVVAVSKAFLPHLKAARGRIVVVSSIFGRLPPGMTASVLYGVSKRAVDSFSNYLRIDMQRFGVTVCTIVPGRFATGIMAADHLADKLKHDYDALPPEKQAEYGTDYLEGLQKTVRNFADGVQDPVHVVDAYEHALTSAFPRMEYRVGFEAKFICPIAEISTLRLAQAVICSTYPSVLNRMDPHTRGPTRRPEPGPQPTQSV